MSKNFKTGLEVNHDSKRIDTTKAFMKYAKIRGSAEYEYLLTVRQENPTYRITTKKINVSSTKKTHKGLTFKRMETHISKQSDKETVIAEFEAKKEEYSARLAYYPKMKSWFLEKYPEWTAEDTAS